MGGAFIDLNVEDCGHFALVEYLTLPLLANLVQSFQELVSMRMTPLLTMDVWEHAYYLDYQNARAKCRNFRGYYVNQQLAAAQ